MIDPLAKIDILYLAWNRRAFTVESLAALRDNTDWSLVRQLWLCDDGSTDGTAELIEEFAFDLGRASCQCPVIHKVTTAYLTPVATMNLYLAYRDPAQWFCKLDSDTVVPPGWLPECINVLRRNPTVDLLGIEPLNTSEITPAPDANRGIRTCGHIGGIGFMRTRIFDGQLPTPNGRLGFSDWQVKHDVVKAWLSPSLPVILLDRLPFEPWRGLSAEYEAKGWQRPWWRYTGADSKLWEWWTKEQV
jgi:glycosyltransferase involved in cell wall biosynthesis